MSSAEPDSDERPRPAGPSRHPVDLGDRRLDADAVKVVRRLVRNGYEAYVVGGGVRDLLLDRSPKDFDIATSARPDDVRTLFRNSRIIGRRFRLVHVLFSGGKVIETATFRRAPDTSEREGDDLLIRNDNVFGDAHEDAARRDFTINALFYDVENKEVIDWVGGMPHIEGRIVHTIGDPVVRFQEDPVRILRAIKFSARLDLGITPEVYDAIVQCRGSLAMAARPRLFEELLRLLREGAAHRSFWLAWETGVLDVLLPELSAYLSDAEEEDGIVWRILRELDRRTNERGEPFDDVVLWTLLLLEPLREITAGEKDRVEAAYDFLEPVIDRLNVPRRIADAVRRIVAIYPRLEAGRAGRFSKTPLFALAAEVHDIHRGAMGHEIRDSATIERADSSLLAPPKRRRRRRRR
ncbi:MAG: polynucleotide adenylyltransferase PcnB [Myxococcales bacterium]|nr:polynucleotide adenylyltransferase PcnB [Myxococcales bacterium]